MIVVMTSIFFPNLPESQIANAKRSSVMMTQRVNTYMSLLSAMGIPDVPERCYGMRHLSSGRKRDAMIQGEMVEMRGIEPLASALRTPRSPS
jgi:hypothetical protein